MTTETRTEKPWWCAGGILAPGQRFNIHAPAFILAATTPHFPAFVVLWLSWILIAKYLYGMNTETCIYSFASYGVSLFLMMYHFFVSDLSNGSTTGDAIQSALCTAVYLWLGTTLKIGICSSGCLHRYGAHTAYKTEGWVKYLICIVGSLANQGGIVWWSSHHRCHHKNCDLPADPHSPKLVGVENAFAFFNSNRTLMKVNDEYVPNHLKDDTVVWVLDTFYWAFCTLEMMAGYALGGWYGFFVSYASGWMSQVGGMIFNVVFHLDETVQTNGKCIATDGGIWMHNQLHYPAFFFISIMGPVVAPFVGEYYHEIHHVKPQLAKRDSLDVGWYLWVYPLMKLGLIWDVHGYADQSAKPLTKKVL